MKKLLPILFLAFLGLMACNKDDNRSEDEIIADFIKENNLKGEFMTDGIFVSIENPGNGEKPTADDRVQAFYEGKYASDGERFDGNLDAANPAEFSLQGVIPGWTKGVPYFGVGDKGWLILPSSQGYGSFPPRDFRLNATLAFYIELVAIK
jgi:FKBP-type peptidyl-prolyl cis-trans isomerase FkpA